MLEEKALIEKVLDLSLPKLNKLIKENVIDVEDLWNTIKKSDITMLRIGKKGELGDNIGD